MWVDRKGLMEDMVRIAEQKAGEPILRETIDAVARAIAEKFAPDVEALVK
ncbi:MAG: hypothetical protein Kow0099_08780 [Candidatus Abyssubacteria bacterium]